MLIIRNLSFNILLPMISNLLILILIFKVGSWFFCEPFRLFAIFSHLTGSARRDLVVGRGVMAGRRGSCSGTWLVAGILAALCNAFDLV